MKTTELTMFMTRATASPFEWNRIKRRCQSRRQTIGRFLVECALKELDREDDYWQKLERGFKKEANRE